MDWGQIIEQHTSLTLDLFRTVLQHGVGTESNVVLSPISIATALAMAAAGARGGTLAEMTSVLKLPEGDAMHQFVSYMKGAVLKDGSGSGGPILSFANGVWVDKSLTLQPKFQSFVREIYKARLEAVDFQGKADEERVAINRWVRDETREKIEELLPAESLDTETRLVLANALYFKGRWATQFSAEATRNETFHLLNGQSVSVPFLTSNRKQCIAEYETHKILQLPYAKGVDPRSFSMYIVLPNDKAGLPDLEKDLDAHTLIEQCRQTKDKGKVEVGNFLLPKFKISSGFSVPESLKVLGMNSPFGQSADFSDIAEGEASAGLYIDEVRHKAFVEVNEEGTEAAATTTVEIALMCYIPPVDFDADHPFLFILQEDLTGTVLFIGRVTNPNVSD